MSASVRAGGNEAGRAARDERAFLLSIAALVALEGLALAWFLG